jgi:Ser-tRNA(Ala) deacylase AlaX
MKPLEVAEVMGNERMYEFIKSWDDVLAKEGQLKLELQNELDERNDMFEADEESFAYEIAVKEAEAEAERLRIVSLLACFMCFMHTI